MNDQGYVPSQDVEEHIADFQRQLKVAKRLNPIHVNSHSGHDSWGPMAGKRFLKQAVKAAEEQQLRVSHETHRRRLFWNPWAAAELLRAVPEARITADLSHWVCVCERLPSEDTDSEWESILQLVAARTDLIHARVGYGEGPQIPHPGLEEYEFEVKTHFKWWDTIWSSAAARGTSCALVEPEFGPAPYQRYPHASAGHEQELWATNLYMAGLVAQHFADNYGGSVPEPMQQSIQAWTPPDHSRQDRPAESTASKAVEEIASMEEIVQKTSVEGSNPRIGNPAFVCLLCSASLAIGAALGFALKR